MRFLFLITAAQANTVSDIFCNGKDAVTFSATKGDGDIGKISTVSCPNEDFELVLGTDYTIDSEDSNLYLFDFNPYEKCMNTPDPDDASTFSVDFKVMMANTQTIDGQEITFGGDQLQLKCTFLKSYEVVSDLGEVELDGEVVEGEEFALDFDIIRTQADYSTEETSAVITNSPIYHKIYATGSDFESTDFVIKPTKVTLRKKNDPDVKFDLFSTTMSECGHEELGFRMNADDDRREWTFKYNGFLLDSELQTEYQIVVELELCSSQASSASCTAANKCLDPIPFDGIPKVTRTCDDPRVCIDDKVALSVGYSLYFTLMIDERPKADSTILTIYPINAEAPETYFIFQLTYDYSKDQIVVNWNCDDIEYKIFNNKPYDVYRIFYFGKPFALRFEVERCPDCEVETYSKMKLYLENQLITSRSVWNEIKPRSPALPTCMDSPIKFEEYGVFLGDPIWEINNFRYDDY